ncbi:MAG: aminotransferase class I/II-fold pyridoxal phosphate-dependent enzyme [bacterium]|nr:aminotransferase class I/II-fold pyridoxal phosphate-dependent enzyme [bacterium]MCP4800646.1 aminotransferase class I/II-fold pyridoxal phosphate-dependent enzyme [bacterium]
MTPSDWDSRPEDEAFREIGYAFVDLMAEYMKGLEGRRVYGPVSPAGLDSLFNEELPEDSQGWDQLIDECRSKIFPNSMAIGSRRYFGMMNPAPLPIAIFADALCSAMNQNAASWRHAPAATAVEKRVVRWFCDLFGMGDESFGTLVPGGSHANITGLKLALNKSLDRDIGTWDEDNCPHLAEMAKLRIYVSDQAHYSFRKAVDILGLCHGQLSKLPVDHLYRIDIQQLENLIKEDIANGLKPCCIVGIAGTTNTGSIDKLDLLADLAEKYNCWYHVDAAYGGAVMLSDKYRHMLDGIQRADSITVDPHKWFYTPFEAGGILVKDGDFLRKGFLVRPEYYMEKQEADERSFHHGDKVNFFQYGISGSRRFNALKLWMTMKMVGRNKYAEWIEKDIELARVLAGLLQQTDEFELTGPNTLGICTFRWVPDSNLSEEDIDQLNRDLQTVVEREGDAWFSHTTLQGQVTLRVNVENRHMERSDILRLLSVLKKTARKLKG